MLSIRNIYLARLLNSCNCCVSTSLCVSIKLDRESFYYGGLFRTHKAVASRKRSNKISVAIVLPILCEWISLKVPICSKCIPYC